MSTRINVETNDSESDVVCISLKNENKNNMYNLGMFKDDVKEFNQLLEQTIVSCGIPSQLMNGTFTCGAELKREDDLQKIIHHVNELFITLYVMNTNDWEAFRT